MRNNASNTLSSHQAHPQSQHCTVRTAISAILVTAGRFVLEMFRPSASGGTSTIATPAFEGAFALMSDIIPPSATEVFTVDVLRSDYSIIFLCYSIQYYPILPMP